MKKQKTEHPALFKPWQVRATFNGEMTQFRVPIKPQPFKDESGEYDIIHGPEWYTPAKETDEGLVPLPEIFGVYDEGGEWGIKSPYGAPGNTLWVRETWKPHSWSADHSFGEIQYKADDRIISLDPGSQGIDVPFNKMYPHHYKIDAWKPSIHMPRWACRLELEVLDVRVEQHLSITEEDAIKSGSPGSSTQSARDWYLFGWEESYGEKGLGCSANPWVWVTEFKIQEAD